MIGYYMDTGRPPEQEDGVYIYVTYICMHLHFRQVTKVDALVTSSPLRRSSEQLPRVSMHTHVLTEAAQ